MKSNRIEPRRDSMKSHLISEHRHDPYKARGKRSGPCVCSQCSVAFSDGRWQWISPPPVGAEQDLCPACHRINDRFPAGELTLSGSFLGKHQAEIVALMRNLETAETADHPLERLMDIEARGDRLVVTTTGLHLPRRIGHAIVAAYKGDLDTTYDEAGHFVRMHWSRDQ